MINVRCNILKSLMRLTTIDTNMFNQYRKHKKHKKRIHVFDDSIFKKQIKQIL